MERAIWLVAIEENDFAPGIYESKPINVADIGDYLTCEIKALQRDWPVEPCIQVRVFTSYARPGKVVWKFLCGFVASGAKLADGTQPEFSSVRRKIKPEPNRWIKIEMEVLLPITTRIALELG